VEFQQIALLSTTTGEVEEKRLAHPDEAEKYYRGLAGGGETVCIKLSRAWDIPPPSECPKSRSLPSLCCQLRVSRIVRFRGNWSECENERVLVAEGGYTLCAHQFQPRLERASPLCQTL